MTYIYMYIYVVRRQRVNNTVYFIACVKGKTKEMDKPNVKESNCYIFSFIFQRHTDYSTIKMSNSKQLIIVLKVTIKSFFSAYKIMNVNIPGVKFPV